MLPSSIGRDSNMRLPKSQMKLIRSLAQKKFRDESGMFVAEGRKCIQELSKTYPVVCFVVADGVVVDLPALLPEEHPQVHCYKATSEEFTRISSLRTPQGILAVFRKKEYPSEDNISPSALVVALDGVQDPGNLGTIIRTCDWFGVRDVYCSLDSADCYNPKVVQATMGALARVAVRYIDLQTWLSNARSMQIPVYGTLLDGRNMYEKDAIPDKNRGIIVMGNEGSGISAPVRTWISHPLFIPPYPINADTSESLNVSIATAVILATFRRG